MGEGDREAVKWVTFRDQKAQGAFTPSVRHSPDTFPIKGKEGF
jgi:hypothetical protein